MSASVMVLLAAAGCLVVLGGIIAVGLWIDRRPE